MLAVSSNFADNNGNGDLPVSMLLNKLFCQICFNIVTIFWERNYLKSHQFYVIQFVLCCTFEQYLQIRISIKSAFVMNEMSLNIIWKVYIIFPLCTCLSENIDRMLLSHRTCSNVETIQGESVRCTSVTIILVFLNDVYQITNLPKLYVMVKWLPNESVNAYFFIFMNEIFNILM